MLPRKQRCQKAKMINLIKPSKRRVIDQEKIFLFETGTIAFLSIKGMLATSKPNQGKDNFLKKNML